MKVSFHRTAKSEVTCVFRAHPIPHCPIATLALLPHSQQRRVTCVDEVDDAHIGLGRVLAVQPARVLLQGPLPRNRHGQHQHLASIAVSVDDLGSNRARSGLINREVPEYILNPCLLRQIYPRVQRARRDRQIVRRTGGLGCCVASWPALHENNRLLTVAANRCGSQPEYVCGFGLLQNRIEGCCADMMASPRCRFFLLASPCRRRWCRPRPGQHPRMIASVPAIA